MGGGKFQSAPQTFKTKTSSATAPSLPWHEPQIKHHSTEPHLQRLGHRASVTSTATRRAHYQRKDAAHKPRPIKKQNINPPLHTKENASAARGRRFWSLPTPPSAPLPIRRGARSGAEIRPPGGRKSAGSRTLLVSYPVRLVEVGGFPCSWSWFFCSRRNPNPSLLPHLFFDADLRGAVLFPVSNFRFFLAIRRFVFCFSGGGDRLQSTAAALRGAEFPRNFWGSE
jgi:hypothetical protein